MAYKEFVVAFSMIVATSSISAARPEPPREGGAPSAPADARYCLRVEPITGSRIETILCRTREQWAALEVDLDKEWPKEGVRVIV